MTAPLSFEDTWEIVKSYFNDESFQDDTVRSYDKFIGNLKNIPIPTVEVEADNVNSNHKDTKHVIRFTKVYVGKPALNEDDPNKKVTFLSHPKSRNKADNITILTAHEAIQRGLTYALPIYYDIIHEVYKKNEGGEYNLQSRKTNNKVCIGDIPLPKGSEWDNSFILPQGKKHECPYEKKGAFIINGMERVVIPQARMEYNSVFVFRKTGNKPHLVAEVRSLAENDYTDPAVITIKFRAVQGRGDEIFKLKFPYGKYEINIVTIFRALGIETDGMICDLIMSGSNNPKMKKCIQYSLEEKEGMAICNQKDALIYIGRKEQSFGDKDDETVTNYAINLLCRDLFPHMGKTRDHFKQKAFYLGFMAHKILRVHLGLAEPDNRDHCARKCFDLVGPLLEDLYVDMMLDLCKDLKIMLGKWLSGGKPIQDITPLMKRKSITQKLEYVYGTGNWTVNANKRTNRTGVTAVWSRQTYASALSHMKRLGTPIGKEGKLSKPRQLQWDSWGKICVSLDTDVLQADGTWKKIKDMTEEDKIATIDTKTMEMSTTGITNLFTIDPLSIGKKMIKITTSSGRVLKCTEDHPLWTKRGWVDAGRISKDDTVFLENEFKIGDYVSIESVETIPNEMVMDFTTLSETHTFIANGFLTHNCPAETPEGTNIGLVNNFALACHVSHGDSSFQLMDIIMDSDMVSLEKCTSEHLPHYRIFVNGKWVGMIKDFKPLYNTLRTMKCTASINPETSISYKTRERSLFISTNSGRVMRPLIKVSNGQSVVTKERIESLRGKINPRYKDSFTSLLAHGEVELLDTSEEDNAYIAMYPRDLPNDNQYTHCEIHPTLIYGELAGSIPYGHHNPPTRTTFQSAMGKQAVSIPMINFDERMDPMFHVLNYPQRPITYTKVSEITKMDEMPAGCEAVVAILCLEGYNKEDAIYINRRCLDFCMFRSDYYKTYKDMEKKLGNHYSEEFKKPNREKCYGMRPSSYEKLEEDGIIGVGTIVGSDDAVIGKTSPYVGADTKFTEKDHSQIHRSSEPGIVDRVLVTVNEDGFRFAKVRIRTTRVPTVGDKFSSRHGQKGVVGLIEDSENLPYSVKDGITPDIVINAHSQPSRMTVAMILEMMAGKIGCLSGKRFDATAFEDCDENEMTTKEKLEQLMFKLGYPPGGQEKFIDGRTGKMLEGMVFQGTCYYQRLKHMVEDKKHGRGRGPVHILTRQPVEGRQRDGGLRFGEMERDCTIAHGTAEVLKTRIMDYSDGCTVHYCKCGLFAYKNAKSKTYHCFRCIKGTEINELQVPYAWKLLNMELLSMGMVPRLVISNDD